MMARRGFTILEFLVTIAVIAALLLVALPAVLYARETTRDRSCQQQLRQIGLALHTYHDCHGRLPAGWKLDAERRTGFGWATPILPFIEQDGLYKMIDLRGSVNQAAAVVPVEPGVALFDCPSDFGAPSFPLYKEHGSHGDPQQLSTEVLSELPRANYVAVYGNSDPDAEVAKPGEGCFVADRGISFAMVKRGLSEVVLVGERTTRKLPSTWLGIELGGEDAEGRVTGNLYLGPNRADADECEFDSRHSGHVNFLWGDGHVAPVANGVDQKVYRAIARRQ